MTLALMLGLGKMISVMRGCWEAIEMALDCALINTQHVGLLLIGLKTANLLKIGG